MSWDFDRVAQARARAAEAQAEYASTCKEAADRLIGEIAALPADRIGRTAAQIRVTLAGAMTESDDLRVRQAWQIIALRHGAPLPGDDTEIELVLRFSRAPNVDDAAQLAAFGLKPTRLNVVGYRGRCSLAAVMPFVERYDGHIQEGSSTPLRARAFRQDERLGEADAATVEPASGSGGELDAAALHDPNDLEEPEPSNRFVPRAPVSRSNAERKFGGGVPARSFDGTRSTEPSIRPEQTSQDQDPVVSSKPTIQSDGALEELRLHEEDGQA